MYDETVDREMFEELLREADSESKLDPSEEAKLRQFGAQRLRTIASMIEDGTIEQMTFREEKMYEPMEDEPDVASARRTGWSLVTIAIYRSEFDDRLKY